MANEVPLPQRENIGQVGEARIYALDPDTGDYVALEVSDGQLQVAAELSADEMTSDITDRDNRVLGNVDVTSLPEPIDVSGATIEVNLTDNMTRDAGTVRLYDRNGTLVDPASENTLEQVVEQTGSYDGLEVFEHSETGQLPSGVVAPGAEVLVQAKPENADTAYVGPSGGPYAVGLEPGQGFTSRVSNTDALGVDLTSGDSVTVTYEVNE